MLICVLTAISYRNGFRMDPPGAPERANYPLEPFFWTHSHRSGTREVTSAVTAGSIPASSPMCSLSSACALYLNKKTAHVRGT